MTRATLPSLAKIKTIRNLNNMKFLATLTTSLLFTLLAQAKESEQKTKSLTDRLAGKGWKSLAEKDFAQVNCDPETFQFKKDGTIHCTGKPSGGLRSVKVYKNFEVTFEWRHLRHAGNAGVFLWCPRSVLDKLPRGRLPQGIEIQILDLGYETNHLKNKGKHSNWFTSHGDVFPVGVGRMKAFTPEITYKAEDGKKYKVGKPTSSRCFPTKRLSKGVGEWNHYYIEAKNAEVRLWVNGEEVSGGYECKPSEGHFVLESEGAPMDYRGMKLRELP